MQKRDFFAQYERNTQPGPNFVGRDVLPERAPTSWPIKPIAYYLPQFHAIPENDLWWGAGFTEWTNVTKAAPRYSGHLQPKLPADLGFYNLAQVDALRRQAELVQRSGVYGLCIHDYWFDGRKVLETPLKLILANPDIDIRFCLNWANENWSRRWDGGDHDILLGQKYDPVKLDGYAHSILPAVRDPRYIRIDGRPLIMIYRPGLAPNGPAMFESWRNLFRREGEGDPYLVMAQAFDDYDPRPYGLDAAAGFPPHNGGSSLPNKRHFLRLLDPLFEGFAASYSDLASRTLENNSADYRLFPGVCPSWDNEARNPRKGRSFFNANPVAFEDWLYRAGKRAQAAPPAERLVFVNAWNEWAEGAVLEPDRHNGFANLVAVRRALERLDDAYCEAGGAPSREPPPLTRPSALNLLGALPHLLRALPRRIARWLQKIN